MNNRFALDMGSANLITSMADSSDVIREPAVIAVNRKKGNVLAVGRDAVGIDSDGKNNVALMRPFRYGVTSDCDVTYRVMSDMLKRSFGRDYRGGRLLISIPCDLDEIGESVLIELAIKAGVKTCHLIYSPVAAMAAEFISPFTSCLLVDIGAVRTNILLLAEGKIIYKRTARTGGETFDAAIADYLLKQHGVQVSMRECEQLKMKLGTVFNDGVVEFSPQTVSGRSLSDGEPTTVTVERDEMYTALEEPMAAVLEAICVAITKIPMQHVDRVLQNGIILCGGGAALHGIPLMIEGITGVPTTLVDRPVEATAIGLARILEWLPERLPSGLHNISGYYLESFLASD